jgi:hypothetical protein
MVIDTKLNDIEATSTRTMKYVRYFGKTMMTDRFMVCMIMMILIVLVALIVVLIIKQK